jgi:hypothetical protein
VNTVDFSRWEKKIPRQPAVLRDDFILSACVGRKVFHLGATDSPMTEDKAQRGELLHQKLQPVCGRLDGFDIDGQAIEFLRRKHGIDNIHLCNLDREIPSEHGLAQVLINGDIVEHVNSPGRLMQACNQMLEQGGVMVLTTINALSAKQAMRAFGAREPVHPDHVAYYSFATLGVLGARFGFEVTDCRFFPYPCVSRVTAMFFGALYRLAPAVADGICVCYRKTREL